MKNVLLGKIGHVDRIATEMSKGQGRPKRKFLSKDKPNFRLGNNTSFKNPADS